LRINPIAIKKAQGLIQQGRQLPTMLKKQLNDYLTSVSSNVNNPAVRTALKTLVGSQNGSGLVGEEYSQPIPVNLVLKRIGFRSFPDGRRVALYSNDKTGLVFTVPFLNSGAVSSEIPAAINMRENSLMLALNLISEEIQSINIEYDNGIFAIDADLADTIIELYSSLNEENQLKFESLFAELKSTEKIQELIAEAGIVVKQARIRRGKLQRRVKMSNLPGYTLRGGRLVHMTSVERIRRRLSQKRASVKRRSKIRSALRKRKFSTQKGKRLGLYR
jgi:hypothetical protein